MDTPQAAGATPSVREWLRGIEAFTGPLPRFDPNAAPDDPVELFLGWLREAVAAGTPDPHSMTLSTVDEHGDPDARVLVLKNVDWHGWQFGAHAASPKGRQLAARSSAALTFYWPNLGRSVRVRGPVLAESAEAGAGDLLARSPRSRAEALLGRQSSHLGSLEARDAAIEATLARVEADPSLVTPLWTLYTLSPREIEFWQADERRNHTRLRYERDERYGQDERHGQDERDDGERPWRRHLLWP